MKKTIAILAVLAVVGVGTVASAHMWGGGYGYGPGHMRDYYGNDKETEKYLDETADLRRELNTKRFEYNEALRAGDEKKAEAIGKDIDGLYDKLGRTPSRGRSFARGGYGPGYCW